MDPSLLGIILTILTSVTAFDANNLPGLLPYYYPRCKNGGQRIFSNGTSECLCTFKEKQVGTLCETIRVNLENPNDAIEVNLLDQVNETRFEIDKVLSDWDKFHLQFSFVSSDFQSFGNLLTLKKNRNEDSYFAELYFTLTGHGLKVTLVDETDKFVIEPFNKSLADNRWHKVDFFIGYDEDQGYLRAVLLIDRCSITKNKCQESVNLSRKYISISSSLIIGNHGVNNGLRQLCMESLIIQNHMVDFWTSTQALDSRRICPSCEHYCQDGVCGKFGKCKNVWSNSSLYTCQCDNGYSPDPIIPPKHSQYLYEHSMIAKQPCNRASQVYRTKLGLFRWKENRGIPIAFSFKFRHLGSSLDLVTIGSWKYYLRVTNSDIEISLNDITTTIKEIPLLDGNWHTVKITISQTNKINGLQSSYVYTDVMIDKLHNSFYQSLLVKGILYQDAPEIRLAFSPNSTCLGDFWVEYPDQEEYHQQFYVFDSLPSHVLEEFFHKGCASENHCKRTLHADDSFGVCPMNRTCSPIWDGYKCDCTDGLVPLKQGLRGEEFCVPIECVPNPCQNNGICQLPTNSSSHSNFECVCAQGTRGDRCQEVHYTANLSSSQEWPLWAILALLAGLLLFLFCLSALLWCLFLRLTKRKRNKKVLKEMAREVEKNDSIINRTHTLEEAGQQDYRGPINYVNIHERSQQPEIPVFKDNKSTLTKNSARSYKTTVNHYPYYLQGPIVEEGEGEEDLGNPNWMANMKRENYLHLDNTLNYAFEGDSEISRNNSVISQMNVNYLKDDKPGKMITHQL